MLKLYVESEIQQGHIMTLQIIHLIFRLDTNDLRDDEAGILNSTFLFLNTLNQQIKKDVQTVLASTFPEVLIEVIEGYYCTLPVSIK